MYSAMAMSSCARASARKRRHKCARVELGLIVDYDAPARIDFDINFSLVGAFTWATAGGDEDNISLELWIR
jgi:hypothetical protein